MRKLASANFGRIGVRISAVALGRLNHECAQRTQDEFANVSQGRVLNELIMRNLPPAPDEVRPKKVARAERPKVQQAAV